MPRIKCPKCSKAESILKSGFIRKKQRFYCKECNYNFTINHETRKKSTDAKKSRQTTITDIAKATGVSASTVSRALHDHPDISARKREMIKSLAQQLDYQPNALAQSLASRTTHTIGVIIPDIERPFFASVISGIQHKAAEFGYKIIICQSNESHATEVANIQTLMTNMVDGLLICHSRQTDNFDHIKMQSRRGIPIIHFDRVCEDMPTSKVMVDDYEGGYCITEHLVKQGYQHIAVLGGPSHLAITQKRIQGYLNALKSNGMDPHKNLITYCDFSKEQTVKAVQNWLKLKTKPDAIFSIFHGGAIDAMMYLKANRVKIPQQMGIAAFGNDPTAAIIEPGLTAFDQQPFKLGEAAVQEFLNQIIKGENYLGKTLIIKGELIIRNSTLLKKGK